MFSVVLGIGLSVLLLSGLVGSSSLRASAFVHPDDFTISVLFVS